MDDRHPHHLHLHAHSRYAALPPQPLPFLDPGHYGHHPHLQFPPAPPPAPPPPSQHHHHHHLHRPDDRRLYLSYPHPPPAHTPDQNRFLAEVERADQLVFSPPALPAPRVSDRIVFPDGHPEAPRLHHQHQHLRRLSNKAYVRDEEEEGRVRVIDEERVAFGWREEERLQEAAAGRRLGFVGRKRARWDQDYVLEEEDGLMEGFEGWDPRRQAVRAGQSRHHRDVVYDVVYELTAPEAAPPGGLRSGLMPERGGDTSFVFGRPSMVSSPGSSSGHTLSTLEVLEKNKRTDSESLNSGRNHGFREKHFTGNGKRTMFGRENEVRQPLKKPPQQKPSILSRLQYGKQVWKRIQEHQIVFPSPPPPVSHPIVVSDHNQLEMDSPVDLDVSFKSNALVAKEILVSPALTTPKSSGKISTVRTPNKKVPKDTPVSPITATLKSDGKVTIMRTPNKKIGEEASISPSPVMLNFDGKSTTTKSPNKVVNEASVLPDNAFQHFVDNVTAVKTTKKKIAEKNVVPGNPAVQNSDGKVNTMGGLKRKLAKEILVTPRIVMSNCRVSMMRTPSKEIVEKKLSSSSPVEGDSDGKVNNEENPKKNLAMGILVPPRTVLLNSDDKVPAMRTPKKKMVSISVSPSQIAPTSDGIITTAGIPMKNMTEEILVTPNIVFSNSNNKVSAMRNPEKEMLEKSLVPPRPFVLNFDGKGTSACSIKKKLDNEILVPQNSTTKSDQKATKLTLKKRVIKKKRKKKVVISITHCLPSLGPKEEFGQGQMSTSFHKDMIHSEVHGQAHEDSTSTSCCKDVNNSEEVHKYIKRSEEVHEVSMSVSPSRDPKHSEDVHDRPVISAFPSDGKVTTVKPLKKKVIRRKKEVVAHVIPCLPSLGSTPEICEGPQPTSSHRDLMHLEEAHEGSASASSHNDLNHSDDLYKDRQHSEKVHRETVSPPLHNNLKYSEDVCNGPTATGSHKDIEHSEENQEIFLSDKPHKDINHAELPERAVISDIGPMIASDSSSQLCSQGVNLLAVLKKDAAEGPAKATVLMDVDITENPTEEIYIKSGLQDVGCFMHLEYLSGDDHLTYGEEQNRNCEHLNLSCVSSSFRKTIPPGLNSDEQVQAAVVFDGEDVDTIEREREGEQWQVSSSPPTSEAGSAIEELRMVSGEKEASAVLPSDIKEKSVILPVEVQSGILEPEREAQKKQSLTRGVSMAAKEDGILGEENFNKDGTVEREGAQAYSIGHSSQNSWCQWNSHMLQIPFPQDTVSDHRSLTRTIGDEGNGLSLPLMNRLIQSENADGRIEQSSQNGVCETNPPEMLSSALENVDFTEMELASCNLSGRKSCYGSGIRDRLDGNSNSKGDSFLDIKSLSLSEPEIHVKLYESVSYDHSISENTLPLPPQETKRQSTASRQGREVLTSKKVPQNHGIPERYPCQTSHAPGSLKKPSSSHNARHHTWHRADRPSISTSAGPLRLSSGSSLHRQSPKKPGKVQSSYIRKGNSLIRKSATVIPPRSSPGQGNLNQTRFETNIIMSFEGKLDSSDHLSASRVGGLSTSFVRPKTPPLPVSSKLTSPQNCPHFSLEDPPSEPGGEGLVLSSAESQNFGSILGSTENQNILMKTKSEVPNARKMIYVKHRLNQLVAAPGADMGNSVIHASDKTKASPFTSSDLYYRRKSNQLIRDTSSSDSQLKPEISFPMVGPNTESQGASKVSSLKCSSKALRKTRLEKAMEKTYKQSKFSLVWTLSGARSHRKHSNFSKRQKIIPYLFPWKRTTYWRRSKNMGSTSNNPPPSLIRKLQLSRKRDTVYTVSKGGFSLRKSGVFGIGGSNLKWSKSIGRNSKKASEEATLAVAEAEKKKRVQKQTTCVGVTLKNGSCLTRERIFRIGTARYKMDSSRRTLIRIPDEQSSSVDTSLSKCNDHKSFVPRRLLIGDDEYIRIGNGNKLVRDPKKLVRILASEKIRWSLHTARLRLARKQQYCQFFTRFGKCNREGGKCPYIHDPTKVAICTKFLKGLCACTNCKLTHKVIPERMPDCSYFLQGLCTNTNCPYRHVNVNTAASVCEGFLKGYCADGDECRKKHSYVCPLFEATGKCPQGSRCKLPHPRRGNKSRKSKRLKVQDYSRGRYFGFNLLSEVGDNNSQIVSSNDGAQEDEDIFFHEGQFSEYISLDIDNGDNNAVETNDPMDPYYPALLDSDLSDSQSDDLDVLIKPVRIMNREPRSV